MTPTDPRDHASLPRPAAGRPVGRIERLRHDPGHRRRLAEDRRARARTRLCDEWRWCELRQDARWDDKVTLALAVASALSQPVLHLPFPADLALIAVIAVKMGLDQTVCC